MTNNTLNERTISYSLLQDEMQNLVTTFNNVSLTGDGSVEFLEKAMAHVMRAKLYLSLDLSQEKIMYNRIRAEQEASAVPVPEPVIAEQSAEESVVEEQPAEEPAPKVEHHSKAIDKFNARQAKTEAMKEGNFVPVKLCKHKCGRKPGVPNKTKSVRITTTRYSESHGPNDFGTKFLTFNNSKDLKYKIVIRSYSEYECYKAKFPYRDWDELGKTSTMDKATSKCREHFREYIRLQDAIKDNDKVQNEK